MPVFEKRNAAEAAALEKLSTRALRERLSGLLDADPPTDGESETILAILRILERRGDGDYLRVDTRAALETFRAEFLPAAEEPEDELDLPAEAERHALPSFLAAFSAGRQPSPREEDALRRMIEDYRQES